MLIKPIIVFSTSSTMIEKITTITTRMTKCVHKNALDDIEDDKIKNYGYNEVIEKDEENVEEKEKAEMEEKGERKTKRKK